MPVQLPGITASATVNPSRFVKYSGANTVAHAGVGEVPFGVSQRGTGTTPLPSAATSAATSGNVISIFGEGEICQIEAGAAIAVGDYLKPGAAGVAIPIVGGEAYYAIALHSAASGEFVDAWVRRGTLPVPHTTIACAGSTKDDAAALVGNTSYEVTGADATKGVILPVPPAAGMVVFIYSSTATNVLKVYPNAGGTINNGTADASVNAAARTPKIARAISTTAWTLL